MPDMGASARELRVEKMRFARNGKATDRSSLIFNDYVTLRGIPEEVDAFVINGRSTLEWLIDRYQVTTDKDSRIVNDPNRYASDPRYVVDLVARMVRVSVESARIVDSLPPLEIIESSSA
jgi:predicted helicase